jgi:xanthine dehydrogenase YagS FAD-binding subunit
MRPFEWAAPTSVAEAAAAAGHGSAFLAGGTTLVDLMKLEVMTPGRVLDIKALPLTGIESTSEGVRIGALERMATVAAHPIIKGRYPAVSQALLASASQQLRNMATIGGNLLQRTRCGYFRDVASACNKRIPGSGCPAAAGANRGHAVLGTSSSCVATHASDLAVALVAFDAAVRLQSSTGTRIVELADFYRLPGDTPEIENDLGEGELITDILVPTLPWAVKSTYVKIRDRQSYEFALSSAAVALKLVDGMITDARVAVGGMATVPWRLVAVEEALRGRRPQEEAFEAAAELATNGARPLSENGFKPLLMKRTIMRALLSVGV